MKYLWPAIFAAAFLAQSARALLLDAQPTEWIRVSFRHIPGEPARNKTAKSDIEFGLRADGVVIWRER